MPQKSTAINQLLASLVKTPRSPNQARVGRETLTYLENFASYLVKDEHLSKGTAAVYKSLCTKALANGGPDLANKQMMSALAALTRWNNR